MKARKRKAKPKIKSIALALEDRWFWTVVSLINSARGIKAIIDFANQLKDHFDDWSK